MRLLVFGGRDYQSFWTVSHAIKHLHERFGIEVVINGGARGADTLGRLAADDHGLPVLTYPADWTTHGKAAGAIRNALMIKEGRPTHGLQLPGGRGTADMRRKLDRAGIPVFEIQLHAFRDHAKIISKTS